MPQNLDLPKYITPTGISIPFLPQKITLSGTGYGYLSAEETESLLYNPATYLFFNNHYYFFSEVVDSTYYYRTVYVKNYNAASFTTQFDYIKIQPYSDNSGATWFVIGVSNNYIGTVTKETTIYEHSLCIKGTGMTDAGRLFEPTFYLTLIHPSEQPLTSNQVWEILKIMDTSSPQIYHPVVGTEGGRMIIGINTMQNTTASFSLISYNSTIGNFIPTVEAILRTTWDNYDIKDQMRLIVNTEISK